MTRIRKACATALLALPLVAGTAAAQEKSLYHRLGGYDAIAAIFDDFGPRLAAEEKMKRFFVGHSANSEMRQRQLVVDLVCQVTGGPCFYIGRDLKTTHAGLGITKDEWDTAANLFMETLKKFKIGEREQQELGALIGPLAKDIVEKP